jgi:hypothetical protein
VLNQSILHVLCEGQQLDQVEQAQVVLRVKETLEVIAPTNFKKAHIYGRLAKEEQVLWFEAIQSNPDREVLWSERVKLKQPNLLKRWQNKDDTPVKLTRDVDLIGSFSNKEKAREKSQFEALMNRDQSPLKPWLPYIAIAVGLIGLLAMAILKGWGPFVGTIESPLSESPSSDPMAGEPPAANPPDSTSSALSPPAVPENSTTTTPPVSPDPAVPDNFYQAVSIANQMTGAGLEAKTPEQWVKVSAGWQQAADLMALVPPDHPRFLEAQQKVKEYQQNQKITLAQAKKSLSN